MLVALQRNGNAKILRRPFGNSNTINDRSRIFTACLRRSWMCVCVCVRVCTYRFPQRISSNIIPHIHSHTQSVTDTHTFSINILLETISPYAWMCVCVLLFYAYRSQNFILLLKFKTSVQFPSQINFKIFFLYENKKKRSGERRRRDTNERKRRTTTTTQNKLCDLDLVCSFVAPRKLCVF